MEREANYTAVGAFVMLVLAMAVAFIYWYSDARRMCGTRSISRARSAA